MRRRLTCTACALAVIMSAGAAHARVLIGVEGGARASDVVGDEDFFGNAHVRPAWSLGVVAEARIAGPWSIVSGARYLEHHDDFDFSILFNPGGVMTLEVDHNLHYVTVPLKLAWRPAGGLVLEAGGDVGYLLDVSSDSEFGSGAFDPSPIQFASIFEGVGTIDAASLYDDWNVAFSAGAGFDFPWADQLLTLRVRYEQGLTNLHPSDEFVQRYSRSIALDAGVRW